MREVSLCTRGRKPCFMELKVKGMRGTVPSRFWQWTWRNVVDIRAKSHFPKILNSQPYRCKVNQNQS
jgi:hypothetical protein